MLLAAALGLLPPFLLRFLAIILNAVNLRFIELGDFDPLL